MQWGKCAEQKQKCQAIIQILEGIDECGITLFDNVIQLDLWEQSQATFQIAKIFDSTIASGFFGKDLKGE